MQQSYFAQNCNKFLDEIFLKFVKKYVLSFLKIIFKKSSLQLFWEETEVQGSCRRRGNWLAGFYDDGDGDGDGDDDGDGDGDNDVINGRWLSLYNDES